MSTISAIFAVVASTPVSSSCSFFSLSASMEDANPDRAMVMKGSAAGIAIFHRDKGDSKADVVEFGSRKLGVDMDEAPMAS